MNKTLRYRELSAEHLRLAEMASNYGIRTQLLHMADSWLNLAMLIEAVSVKHSDDGRPGRPDQYPPPQSARRLAGEGKSATRAVKS